MSVFLKRVALVHVCQNSTGGWGVGIGIQASLGGIARPSLKIKLKRKNILKKERKEGTV